MIPQLVLRRVHEMHQLVENSEKYLTEQENLERLNALSEWQGRPAWTSRRQRRAGPAEAQRLAAAAHQGPRPPPSGALFSNAAIELLRQETTCSESDNDSVYTPHHSPKHKQPPSDAGATANRVSFGLRNPDGGADRAGLPDRLRGHQEQRRERRRGRRARRHRRHVRLRPGHHRPDDGPAPSTPDELDCALPSPISVPPRSFADSMDKLNKLGKSRFEYYRRCAVGKRQEVPVYGCPRRRLVVWMNDVVGDGVDVRPLPRGDATRYGNSCAASLCLLSGEFGKFSHVEVPVRNSPTWEKIKPHVVDAGSQTYHSSVRQVPLGRPAETT
ncbi:hypothetical protein NQ318_000125 [Aromia moschata]|uniref:Uncharacterized protein n=1 Tax=Aromia moschata TaxID=1265417 RepID=A0AAV8X245_9CUCU|nr:hypothetical protein NQ318_000125 [Aromia moschata]